MLLWMGAEVEVLELPRNSLHLLIPLRSPCRPPAPRFPSLPSLLHRATIEKY